MGLRVCNVVNLHSFAAFTLFVVKNLRGNLTIYGEYTNRSPSLQEFPLWFHVLQNKCHIVLHDHCGGILPTCFIFTALQQILDTSFKVRSSQVPAASILRSKPRAFDARRVPVVWPGINAFGS